ncbi:hypothetical protein [Alteromonas gilva]|uniref:Cupric reductase n=1 Tax=Alteromonas gilva TaxID=2987522 RepID=A0ABT5KZE7_9ALTE|nr:hypothetical protein [Alteromonas gilva]MDC8830135.1 hypothetical protein [Alteromonas gilva]
MKKFILALAIVAVAGLLYFYYSEHVSPDKNTSLNSTSPAKSDKGSDTVIPTTGKKSASQKLKELTTANAQCKESRLDFNSQVRNIHQILVQALEQELRHGKTVRELLSYSDQYKTFYHSYEDLLLQAQTNIESEKYQFTTSPGILNHWRGLSVIDNFSAENLPIIVQGLQGLEGKALGLSMNFALNSEMTKTDIFALLENDETFNTYLQSPLAVNGSLVLSPSILFVLSGQKLSLEEFEQAVSLKNFNVNDVAAAIRNDLPYDYLALLIEQTTALEDMPVIAQSRHDAYANLADLAAARHNVKLLQLLATYGVHPSNELGIITGLDIAIINLPDEPDAYTDAERLPDRYLATINYLMDKGYKAHGFDYEINNEPTIIFEAPNRQTFQLFHQLAPDIKKALRQADLVETSYYIQQVPADNSKVSKAIDAVEQKKAALNAQSASCASIEKALLAEKGFMDHREVYALIKRIAKEGGNTAERLHDIDPVLVNLWRKTSLQGYTGQNGQSDFVAMLKAQQFQKALDYSSSTPLTEAETDSLIFALVQHTEQALPIWQARVNPLPPSDLLMFQHLSVINWQKLKNEGFDFGVKDKFGNDLFTAAALSSPEAVELLLNIDLSPVLDNLGADAVDLLLEDSYKNGQLHESLSLLIPAIKNVEPNHYARAARLKKFFPGEYEKLVQLDDRFEVARGTKMNEFRWRRY